MDLSKHKGTHGVVLLTNSSEASVKRLADSFLAGGFCKDPVKEIIQLENNNGYALIWPEGVSVNMPAIMRGFSSIPVPNFLAITLSEYINKHSARPHS